ncbi:hypothetical protein M231_00749 [Tremella mesenterica]|uniref:3'-5' exonuclease domain-containing protein n=1 Tax=Tremella mesenterica TaxID=5217 RepID=A0A4Q1BVD0_TREME|nr:hypothetical protein M231_00749 [Tremella mesenterica]
MSPHSNNNNLSLSKSETSSKSVRNLIKVTKPQPVQMIDKQLQDLVRPWVGKSVFTTRTTPLLPLSDNIPDSSITRIPTTKPTSSSAPPTLTSPNEDFGTNDKTSIPGSPSSTSYHTARCETPRNSSPISIHSSPSPHRPLSAPRVSSHSPSSKVALESKPEGITSYSISRTIAKPYPNTKSTFKPHQPVHPFFVQYMRSKSAPLPTTNRPRFLATHSTTSTSSKMIKDDESLIIAETQESLKTEVQSIPDDEISCSPFDYHGKEEGRGQIKQVWKRERIVPSEFKRTEEDMAFIAEELEFLAGPSRHPVLTLASKSAPMPKAAPTPLLKPRPTPSLKTKSTVLKSKMKGKMKAELNELPSPIIPPKTARDLENLPTFHYSTYSAKNGRTPQVVYTLSDEEADDLVPCLRGEVVGFDLEWPGQVKTWVKEGDGWKVKFEQGQTAVVQVCDDRIILVIHLKDMKRLPKSIVDLICDEKKYKVGVAINGDCKKLLRDFPTQFKSKPLCSILDLSHLARRADPIGTGPGGTLISLANLTRAYLSHELPKPADTRKGDWSATLNAEQIDYAANDVWASYNIVTELSELAETNGKSLDLSKVAFDLNRPISRVVKAQKTDDEAGEGEVEERVVELSFAKEQALRKFKEGLSCQDIAQEGGIRDTTVSSYICEALRILTPSVIKQEDQRRLLHEIRGHHYVQRKFRLMLRGMRKEVGSDQSTSETELETESMKQGGDVRV